MPPLVEYRYNAGYIALSYLVSLAGCWTALELLNRRTSTRGVHNWYLLLGSACSMGAVAIWSMHYIGNRAISMQNGDPAAQIRYSPGFTAGSFVLSCGSVGLAFYVFGSTEEPSLPITFLAGFLMGSAICGMHYMGQGGISNYTPIYDWPWVLAAAILAIVASTIALGIFFYFRSIWANSWRKRVACAGLLAGAVSGMHWLATRGTRYRFVTNADAFNANGLSRQAVVIVVICLSIGACMTLIGMTILSQRSRKRSTTRAQQIVLACAFFDSNDRLMVNANGQFHCRKFANAYLEKPLENEFDVRHPAFEWIYKASRCWKEVGEILPVIRDHISRVETDQRRGSDGQKQHKLDFGELFCLTAAELANSMQIKLEDMGILFGDILCTGSVAFIKSHQSKDRERQHEDLEHGLVLSQLGKGQLLFLVRRLSSSEAAHLQAMGHRFTSTSTVIDSLSRDVLVQKDVVAQHIRNLQHLARDGCLPKPGVHVGCFVLRPTPHHGFDVLVRKFARHLLPMVPLQSSRLEPWQLEILVELHMCSMSQCIERLRQGVDLAHPGHRPYLTQLLRSFEDLSSFGKILYGTRLIAQPYVLPSAPYQYSTLVAFETIADIHDSIERNDLIEYSPLKCFLMQQHAYPTSRNLAIFGRRLKLDCASSSRSEDSSFKASHQRLFSSGPKTLYNSLPSPRSLPYPCVADMRQCLPLEKTRVQERCPPIPGAIRVTNEIEIRSSRDSLASCATTQDGPRVELEEEESYADKLVAFTVNGLRR